MDVGPICQWLILLLMSLKQTENGLVPSFLNQTENELISSHEPEIGPSTPPCLQTKRYLSDLAGEVHDNWQGPCKSFQLISIPVDLSVSLTDHVAIVI